MYTLYFINRSSTTELDHQLFNWFCFLQTENGKIPIVFHSSNESQRVVNFKKALISGFQANFAGTEEVEEVDPDSDHISHYRSAWGGGGGGGGGG